VPSSPCGRGRFAHRVFDADRLWAVAGISRTAGSVAVSGVLAFAAAEFRIATRIRRRERVHSFRLFREMRVGFGRVARRLVRASL
jgi:hypothetical protein